MRLSKIQQTMLPALLAGCLALGAMACDKKGAIDSIPSDVQGRIDGLAANFPASAEGAVFVGEIGQMTKALGVLQTNLSTALPQIEAGRQQAQAELGFDPLDENAWKQAGVPANSGFALGTMNAHAVMLVYVEDRQKFDAALTGQLQKVLGVKTGPTATKDGDYALKTLKGEGTREIVWLHKGKLAMLTGPALDEKAKTDATQTPAKLLVQLASQKPEQSMLQTPEFIRFTKAMGRDHAMLAFANVKRIAKNPLYMNGKQSQDEQQKMVTDWLEKHGETLGLGLGANEKEIHLTSFFGATDAVNKDVRSWGTPLSDGPWDAFATDSMMMGLRASVNPEKIWDYYTKQAPPEQRAEFARGVEQFNAQLGLDLERDLIRSLSGNAGLFFYGIDFGGAMQGMNNPLAMAKALNLALGLQFKDKAGVDKLVAALKEKGGESFVGRPLKLGETEVPEITVFQSQGGEASLFVKDNMVVVGTGALSEADGHQYLTNKLEGKAKLSEKGGELGKSFAQAKPYNGLYINMERLTAVVGLLLANNPYMDVLSRLSETSVLADANDQGMFLHLRLMLKPSPKK